jgi:divinyl protochlorophyllide a 8-vinyl-reductase
VAAVPDKLIPDSDPGRIGPNAITRLAEALEREVGPDRTAGLFRDAGLATYLETPPRQMVAEREVIALHRIVWSRLGDDLARQSSRAAGRRTGDYLLDHRIPGRAQTILRLLPPTLASRALLAAIRRHAWTFAGSGHFHAIGGHPTRLAIRGCPICRGARAEGPICDYYASTFERLFQALVSPRASVTETTCQANGADACRFEIRWR